MGCIVGLKVHDVQAVWRAEGFEETNCWSAERAKCVLALPVLPATITFPAEFSLGKRVVQH